MAWSAAETPPQAWAACWRRVQPVAHEGSWLLPLTRTCAATRDAKRRAESTGGAVTGASFIARMRPRGSTVAWVEGASNGRRWCSSSSGRVDARKGAECAISASADDGGGGETGTSAEGVSSAARRRGRVGGAARCREWVCARLGQVRWTARPGFPMRGCALRVLRQGSDGSCVCGPEIELQCIPELLFLNINFRILGGRSHLRD